MLLSAGEWFPNTVTPLYWMQVRCDSVQWVVGVRWGVGWGVECPSRLVRHARHLVSTPPGVGCEVSLALGVPAHALCVACAAAQHSPPPGRTAAAAPPTHSRGTPNSTCASPASCLLGAPPAVLGTTQLRWGPHCRPWTCRGRCWGGPKACRRPLGPRCSAAHPLFDVGSTLAGVQPPLGVLGCRRSSSCLTGRSCSSPSSMGSGRRSSWRAPCAPSPTRWSACGRALLLLLRSGMPARRPPARCWAALSRCHGQVVLPLLVGPGPVLLSFSTQVRPPRSTDRALQ